MRRTPRSTSDSTSTPDARWAIARVAQARKVRQVIAAFGRHPHRNRVLGRASTAEEAAYIGEGRFPHLEAFDA